MKKFFAVVVSSMLLVGGAEAYAASSDQPSVAIVNVQQIFQQSSKIASLNKKLQGDFKGRQDKLIAAQKSLQDEMDQLKRESATMSKKDRDAMQKKIADDQASLSKDATAFQQDLSKEQGKIMKGVIGDLNGIVSSIAKKNSYSLVLDAQAVVYAADSTDITKQVENEFDKGA